MKKLLLIAAAMTPLAFATVPAMAQSPMIFAPNGQYLGNLNNNQLDPNSVSNPLGRYGNPLSPDSINNPLGQYGNPLSPNSVRNPYAPVNPYNPY